MTLGAEILNVDWGIKYWNFISTYQKFATVGSTRFSLSWDIMQLTFVVIDWRFGDNFGPVFKGQSVYVETS